MIKVENTSFSYGKNLILENINLKFEKGKLYVIAGPNGSGKTTLIKLLSRITEPKKGKIQVDENYYKSISIKDFAKKVALLPQGRNTPDVSVFDLICYGRFPYLDISRKLNDKDYKIVNSALESTNTKELAYKNVKKLSGGERQRAYIAMLLAQATPYILLDEPTTHLDISCGFQIMELLHSIKKDGKCVIAVLHDLPMALKYADEIIVMNKGKIEFTGSPHSIVTNKVLESVFKVKFNTAVINGNTEYILTK